MNAWFAGLAEREKRFVLFGGVAAVIALIVGVAWPLNSKVTATRARIETKQSDLAFIAAAVPQLGGSSGGVGAPVPGEQLLVFIDSSARESGLGKSLISSDPTADRKGLRIRFDKVPFDGLVAWLARLSQNHGITVETADIESAGEAGLVNAGLTLRGA